MLCALKTVFPERSEVKLRVSFPEPPGREDKEEEEEEAEAEAEEEEEAGEGAAPSAADGDGDTERPADASTPAGELPVTSPPQSTGERGRSSLCKQTLRIRSTCLRCRTVRRSGGRTTGCLFHQSSCGCLNICKSVR